MAVVDMQKVSICAPKRNRKDVLEALQGMGIMEIHEEDIPADGLEQLDTQAQRVRFEKCSDTFDEALRVISLYAPREKNGISAFSGKEQVSRARFRDIEANSKAHLDAAQDVVRLQKDIDEARGTILRDQTAQAALAPWEKLDVPLGYRGTEFSGFVAGTLPGTLETSEVYAQVTQGMKDPVPVDVTVLDHAGNLTYVAIVYHRTVEATLESNLRDDGFARPQTGVGSKSTPAELIKKYDDECAQMRSKIDACTKEIVTFANRRDDFRVASDYYRARADRYSVLGSLLQSKSTFFMEGWVQAKHADGLIKLMEDKYDAVVEKEEPREGEVAPTVLRNNRFSAITESVTESYGLPMHGKVDPTFLMSFFYVFFFGMMLSDAGYGLLMSVATGVALLKFKHMESGIKKMAQLFFWCGLSTMFWGAMYGGFFGDAVTVIAQTFFGYTGDAIIKPLWFDPMGNPMRLLVWCLLFGCIHLFMGLGVKGYEMLRDGDVLGFFSDVVSWFVFLLGLILMLVPSDLFAGIAGMTFSFPAFMGPLAKGMAIIGALVIVVMSGRGHKNWGIRIALGAYDLYGVTSWLSDALSYSRLLALGLATGVIASVVNMMAAMVAKGSGFIGVILFILIFLLGHAMNLAINLLGAYVHTNRLQYVEFFGKFYEAGGRAFKPFGSKFKYIEIGEEN